eukprot:5810141-Lingulodinium_polyedra.AAC.1
MLGELWPLAVWQLLRHLEHVVLACPAFAWRKQARPPASPRADAMQLRTEAAGDGRMAAGDLGQRC